MRALLIIMLACVPLLAWADEWDEFVEYMTTQDEVEDEVLAEQLEALEQIHLAPLNINACTRVDLEQISILSAEQIEDIIYYVARVQGMKTLGELVYIQSIDYMTRRWLPLFVYAGEMPSAVRKWRWRNGRHELLTRVDVPLYERAGYTTAKEARRYQGSRVAHNLRYRFTIKDKLSVGLVIDKDQGEPVGRQFTLGYDFVGGHVMLKNVGPLHALVLGDYRVGWGEGLLLNQHFMMGKAVQNINRAAGIAAKTSTSETNFMRGAAATVGIGRQVSLSAFVSYNLMDATVDKSTGMATNLSTVTTHRNQTEIAKWHNTSETAYGGHVEWRRQTFHLGATAYGSRFFLPFKRGDALYREFAPEGNRFWGVSADYGLALGRWTVKGETATDGHGLATLHRLAYRHSARLMAQAAYRYYAPQYHSFHSRALAEWGVQNETGTYLSVEAQPWRPLQLTASADFFRSPHARYGIDHATSGHELRLTATYTLSSRQSLTARAAWKRKEQYNIMHSHQRYHLGWSARFGHFDLRTRGQLAHYSDARGRRSLGYDLQQTARWQDRRDRVRLALAAAWFDTDDYYSRVYLIEPTTLGGMHSTMLYGRGVRLAATARANLTWRCMLMVRYTLSRYLDRDTIGDDLQLIGAPWQNDLSLQLRVKL